MSSKRADSITEMTFASFFHDDTEVDRVDQVEWIEEKLGLPDSFFSNMLGVEEHLFSAWRTKNGVIPEEKQDYLKEFWQTLNHILVFLNYDVRRVLVMLEKDSVETGYIRLAFTPPWVGNSMKHYLETHGLEGIRKVNEWIQSVRFADSY